MAKAPLFELNGRVICFSTAIIPENNLCSCLGPKENVYLTLSGVNMRKNDHSGNNRARNRLKRTIALADEIEKLAIIPFTSYRITSEQKILVFGAHRHPFSPSLGLPHRLSALRWLVNFGLRRFPSRELLRSKRFLVLAGGFFRTLSVSSSLWDIESESFLGEVEKFFPRIAEARVKYVRHCIRATYHWSGRNEQVFVRKQQFIASEDIHM